MPKTVNHNEMHLVGVWRFSAKSALVSHHSTVEEVISKTIDNVYELCPHNFISKAQANHLKTAKENLVIILLDFVENY